MNSSTTSAILFISRVFPPTKGGMQKVAFQLLQALRNNPQISVTAVIASLKRAWFPFVAPYLLVHGLIRLLTNRSIRTVYGTDGAVAPIVWLLARLFRKRAVVTVHGLDITHRGRLYRLSVLPALRGVDELIAVSGATAEMARKAGVSRDRIRIIPNGIDPDELYLPDCSRAELEEKVHQRYQGVPALSDRTILITVGRLVERKGVAWFVTNVMPQLDDRVLYFICGDGPERGAIESAIRESEQEKRVIMLGEVDDELLRRLYNTADLFVMPNVPVPGDMEGFGLVALEASSCGTPILAADIEGIRDAVIEGETGQRVPARAREVWQSAIHAMIGAPLAREAVREAVRAHYDWSITVGAYLKALGHYQRNRSTE